MLRNRTVQPVYDIFVFMFFLDFENCYIMIGQDKRFPGFTLHEYCDY